ncbi:MAG TPA: response regulator [Thermoanaerobaculia bacterium]|jgi:CheY-like chemotaxis protein|nr:response regulator [Thermoanaerobaculia bacterium]
MPLLKPPRPPGSRSWAPFALLALGLASIGLLLGGDARRERLLSEDFALVRATGEIETGLATSHLWMEQYVTGDAAIKPEEIWRGIERSLALVRAMLSGDRLEEGPWRLRLTDDPALRRQAEEIDRGLRTFAATTLKRQTGYEKGEAVGPGSTLDADYDRTFRRLAAATAGLRAAAERRLASRVSLFRLYTRAILAGGLAILGVSFLGFRRFEERHRRAETVLRYRELQLVQAQKMEAVGRLPGGSERILLVEDDAQVRESTLGLLESVGYGVTAVADGSQALTALELASEPFDLLITDVVMPGLSGPEIAGRVRAHQGPVPVVFVSGYSESVVDFHGLLQPGANFLAKPFAASALFKKVREALDGSAALPARPHPSP